jgi:hypothetical protein
MTETTPILGQAAPSGITDTLLFAVPSGSAAVVSLLAICNQTGGSLTFRVAVIPAGTLVKDVAAQHYIRFDQTIAAHDFHDIRGITLGAGDQIMVRLSAQGVSFTAFGSLRST